MRAQYSRVIKKCQAALIPFLKSRQVMGVTESTLGFYRFKLGRFLLEVDPDTATRQGIEQFLVQFDNPGNRHTYYRAIKTFYNWRKEVYDTPSPMKYIRAPILPRLILPSLSRRDVERLISMADGNRNKAIIALFSESGLRLTELLNIKAQDIDWDNHTITVLGKGQKEALASFSKLTEKYLSLWLSQYSPDNGSNIWGLNKWGIISMLKRLSDESGLPCNPHTFRRTFACILRLAGLDILTIKDLGRWESVEMVQRYTRSITFQDCMRLYEGVLM
ncbi:MAG: site-specific integrase [Chloroflexota bacterium]